MIYVVSKDIDVSGMEGIEKISIADSIDLIKPWPVKQYDSETTGLNARLCDMTAMQFGYKDFKKSTSDQVVIDCKTVSPLEYKDILETSHIVGHNLKFDLKFLYNYGIVPRNVYCTLICEQLLYLGYETGKVPFGLDDVLKRYTGEEIDKTFQKTVAYEGIRTERGIRYAAEDVVHLQDIRKAQMLIAKDRDCLGAFYVENRAVPAISYLEWCGIHLDEDKWKQKMTKDKTEMEDYLAKLNEYVLSHDALNKEFVTTTADSTSDLVSDTSLFEFEPKCFVDWNSPQQCVPVFKQLGFNTTTFDKEKKKDKDTVLEKFISTQKGIADDFLDIYFGYKGAATNVKSFGQGHLNLINPKTGRLHTEFNQLGTVTGRMSSGGSKSTVGKKDIDLAKVKKLNSEDVRFVNLQNLPARGDYGKVCRSCFTAMPGNVFISCDYGAEESRVQADVWNEKSLLDSFEQGIDTHNLYAKLCFPEELKDVDVKDVKKVRPDLRQAAKSAEFALGYGSDGSAIAASIGMPVEKAREMVSGILKGMPGMANFKKNTIKFLKSHGYIVIHPATGHRVYWPKWAIWKAQQDRMDNDFWLDYNMYHKGTGDSVCEMVAEHKAMAKDWFEKNVLNYPIQGGSAIVLKQAAADFFDWVVTHGYFNKILFCVLVHDEIDIECPKEIQDECAKALQSIMEKAASKFYHKLPIPAEAQIANYWLH